MWFSFAPTKVPQVTFATNLLIRNSIIAMAADMEEVLIADMQHWRDALRISFIRTVGSKYLLNKKYLPLLVLLTGQTEHARMDLVFNLHGSITYLDVSIVAPFSCNPSLVSAASTKPGLMAKRAEKTKFDRYPHINLVPFILETTGRPGPHARKPTNSCQRHLVHHPKCSSQCHLQTTNSRQPLRDSWGLLSHPVALYIWYLWLPVLDTRERTQPISVSRPL